MDTSYKKIINNELNVHKKVLEDIEDILINNLEKTTRIIVEAIAKNKKSSHLWQWWERMRCPKCGQRTCG